MQRLILITAVCIGLFLVSMVFQYRQPTTPEQQLAKTEPEPEADYYFVGTLSKHYNEQGRFDYEFHARRVEHFVTGDFTLVDAPNMILYPEKGVPWQVQARQGRGVAGNETVELWEDVLVNRDSPDNPLQMNTETLALQPARNLATTEDDIVITSAQGRVDATGMKAYIDKNRLELLSNVRVQHDPNQIH